LDTAVEDMIRDIRRATRRNFSAEEKIRIVLEGLPGEESIAELCRREGIATSVYYGWSKEFLEAGKKRVAGDTARAACPGAFFNPFAFFMHAMRPDFKAAPPAGLFAAIISSCVATTIGFAMMAWTIAVAVVFS
jgi:hypothetical protein